LFNDFDDPDEQITAGVMTVAVINRLEIVGIEINERESRFCNAGCARDFAM
jgi:hypothetical protein